MLEFRVNGRIAKPVAEVFDAVVNPEKLSGYFTTIGGASGPLVAGTTVTWWNMAPVIVDEVEENSRIVFRWDAMVEKGEEPYKTRVEMRFIPLETVIAEYLDRLFPGMELLESYPFRVTRAADIAKLEEPAEDLLESVQEELRARRFASVVRLEVVPEMPQWMRSLIADELAVGTDDIYEVRAPLAARDLF